MLRSRSVVIAFSVVVFATACSTFEGRHLAPGEKLPGPDWYLLSGNGGIPYNLPAAQYTLQRTIVEGQARYAVGVGYAPDPAQRFTLRVDPAFLTSVGFDVDLGEKGEITQIGATTKDQVVPTIQAVGAIVGSFLTGSLPVPFMEERVEKPPPPTPLKLDDLLPDCQPRQPAADSLVCRYVRLVAEKEDHPKPTRRSMVIFARRYVLDYFGKALPQTNDSGFRSDLHARTNQEQKVLVAIEKDEGSEPAATESVLRRFREIMQACLGDPQRDAITKDLSARFASKSAGQLADVAREALVGRREALLALLGPPAAGQPAPNIPIIGQVARALLIAVEPGPAEPKRITSPKDRNEGLRTEACVGHDLGALWRAARERVAEVELRETLEEAIALGPDEWRARHLRYLDLRLAEIAQRDLLAGPGIAPDTRSAGAEQTPRDARCPLPQLIQEASASTAASEEEAAKQDYARCLEERAWTIGEYETLHRLHEAELLLATVPAPTGGEEVGVFEEYARLSALAVSLRERLEQAASRVRQAGMAPGVKPFDPKEVPIVALACVIGEPGTGDCNSVDAWPAVADTAEFVITLTKLAGEVP